jgi:DNA-binding winged helix-turn-helix (wHTH) protein
MADSSSATFPPAGDAPERGSGVRFGVFEMDFDAAELRKRGLRVRLQEQPFRVLSLLLEQPGRVVGREELQSKLWAGDTFVDFDHGLNTAINKIRQALGDSAANPRFIETVHRRGYRFIAPVERVGVAADAAGIAGLVVEPAATGTAAADPVDIGPAEAAGAVAAPTLREPGPPEPGGAALLGAPTAAGPAPTTAQDVVRTFGAWIQTKASALGGNEEPNPAAAPSGPKEPAGEEPAPQRQWPQVIVAVLGSLALAYAVVLLLTVFGFVKQRVEQAFEQQPQRILPAVVNQVRILAGQSSDYVSATERPWTADRFFVGGSTTKRTRVVIGADPNLFQGERYGSFQYVLPAVPRKYRLTLYFAETWFGPGNDGGGGPGSRVFDVECNGEALFRGLDIYRQAGGPNRALVKTFENIEPDAQGHIVLTFLPRANNAMVNALELVPSE